MRKPDDFEALGYREFVKAKVRAGAASAARATRSLDDAARRVKARIEKDATPGARAVTAPT